VTCVRTVVGKPFQFSDGLALPVGSRFGFPAQAIQHDNEELSNPTQFDGYRYASKAQKEVSDMDVDKRYSASSVDTHYLP
jgi:aspirochlorine biosynthesis cytochrome P450 monooxygenase